MLLFEHNHQHNLHMFTCYYYSLWVWYRVIVCCLCVLCLFWKGNKIIRWRRKRWKKGERKITRTNWNFKPILLRLLFIFFPLRFKVIWAYFSFLFNQYCYSHLHYFIALLLLMFAWYYFVSSMTCVIGSSFIILWFSYEKTLTRLILQVYNANSFKCSLNSWLVNGFWADDETGVRWCL